jgi:hypothetical protein
LYRGLSVTRSVRAGFRLGGYNPSSREAVVVPVASGVPGAFHTVSGTTGTTDDFGVACVSATTCVGVANNGHASGVALTTSGGVPGSIKTVSGTVFLQGVACAKATKCETVGSNASSHGVTVVLSIRH